MILKKGLSLQLSTNLNTDEIDCKCQNHSCRATIFEESVIKSFQLSRLELGRAIKVNSGYRCPSHNAVIGGSPTSKHQAGFAIDLAVPVGVSLFEFVTVLKKHFKQVIIYKEQGFCHCSNYIN